MSANKKQSPPKQRIPLPKKPPKVEQNARKEERRRRARKPVTPESEDE